MKLRCETKDFFLLLCKPLMIVFSQHSHQAYALRGMLKFGGFLILSNRGEYA